MERMNSLKKKNNEKLRTERNKRLYDWLRTVVKLCFIALLSFVLLYTAYIPFLKRVLLNRLSYACHGYPMDVIAGTLTVVTSRQKRESLKTNFFFYNYKLLTP